MSHKKDIVILICLVYFSSITPILINALSDGDCLGYRSFDFFRHSPGNYHSKNQIDGQLCASLCSDAAMPHAGVVGKRHCLCAYESHSIQDIEIVPTELCQSSDDYTRYYQGKVIHPVTGLAIKPSKTKAKVEETIEFEISIVTGVDVEYSIDFGDGSEPTEWDSGTIKKHSFYQTGKYMVAVYAKQHQRFHRRIMSEYVWVDIVSKIHKKSVNFKCPKVVEPGDSTLCNLTVNNGHDLQMAISYGDETEAVNFNLPGK